MPDMSKVSATQGSQRWGQVPTTLVAPHDREHGREAQNRWCERTQTGRSDWYFCAVACNAADMETARVPTLEPAMEQEIEHAWASLLGQADAIADDITLTLIERDPYWSEQRPDRQADLRSEERRVGKEC